MFNALLGHEDYAQVSAYPPNLRGRKLFAELRKVAGGRGVMDCGGSEGIKKVLI
jgi:hypothetical protein